MVYSTGGGVCGDSMDETGASFEGVVDKKEGERRGAQFWLVSSSHTAEI